VSPQSSNQISPGSQSKTNRFRVTTRSVSAIYSERRELGINAAGKEYVKRVPFTDEENAL
jgi:hypothetical protein